MSVRALFCLSLYGNQFQGIKIEDIGLKFDKSIGSFPGQLSIENGRNR